MASLSKHSGVDRSSRSDDIVDAALEMAADCGWENVRLRLVADRLGISMDELACHFSDADAIADAWFARARQAMLMPQDDMFSERPAHERLRILLQCWLQALAPHKGVTIDILKTKMWPFHPHHWVPMIFNLSRTVVWLRDAAGLDAGGPRKAVEEVGLTWLFLATLAVWSKDDSLHQARTIRFLSRRLIDADALISLLFTKRDTRGPQGGAVCDS